MKKKKEKLTITLSSEVYEYIENNYDKKSRFIEHCIREELEKFSLLKNETNV